MGVLSGWKEIADHLHLTVRTAQRWERLGLPVHRVSDSSCSPVVTTTDELELWMRSREVKANSSRPTINKSLLTTFTKLRESHFRTRRRTQRLLNQLNELGNEQRKILSDIRLNLTAVTM